MMWSFIRTVLSRGCAIEVDTATLGRTYEEHSARLDQAARDLESQFWEPIETAPMDGTPVLFSSTAGNVVDSGSYNQKVCRWMIGHIVPAGYQPTHWANIPNAPVK